MNNLTAAGGRGCARAPFRSERHPFPILSSRVVERSFVSAVATPGHPSRIVEQHPGLCVRVCDIEGEQVLFARGRNWYRCYIDEFLDATRAGSGIGPLSCRA